MQNPTETLIAHHLAYTFLSKVFYEPPTRDWIDTLITEALFDDFPLESAHPEVETGLKLLRQFCASWHENDLEALQHDYRRLFVGPGRLLATPWESVYLSPDHLMFDVQTVQVRRAYQRYGMAIPNLNNEPDDHLGLELRFLAHLNALGLEALNRNQPELLEGVIEGMRSFMSVHLLKWAPRCLRLVIVNASSSYYVGCAHLALGTLIHTDELLQVEAAR